MNGVCKWFARNKSKDRRQTVRAVPINHRRRDDGRREEDWEKKGKKIEKEKGRGKGEKKKEKKEKWEERKKNKYAHVARRLPVPVAVRRRSDPDFHPACPSRCHFSTPPHPRRTIIFYFHCPAIEKSPRDSPSVGETVAVTRGFHRARI